MGKVEKLLKILGPQALATGPTDGQGRNLMNVSTTVTIQLESHQAAALCGVLGANLGIGEVGEFFDELCDQIQYRIGDADMPYLESFETVKCTVGDVSTQGWTTRETWA